MRRIACIFIVASLAVAGAFAQAQDLGEVSVVAESWSPASLAPGGSVVVVTAEDIAASGAADAAEALESVAGFQSGDYGYAGSVRTPSIRGASSSQVLVIVDGVRRNDARSANVDLSDIPAESIERIEVLKGGASSLYGADAVGGVIVITTKHGGATTATVTAENATYPLAVGEDASFLASAQRLGLSGQTKIGAVGLSAAASVERAADSFPAVAADGSALVRENTDLLAVAGSVGTEAPALGGVVTASASGRYADMGTPGKVSSPSPDARQTAVDARGTVAYSIDSLAEGSLALGASAFGAWSRMEYPAESSLHDSVSTGADIRARFYASDAIEIPAGVELRFDGADSNKVGTPTRLHVGAYAAPIMAIGDALEIAPSVRYDWYDDYSAGLTYALGFVGTVGDGIVVRMTGGRSYRAPCFNDLYWPSDPWTEGNPALVPETSWYSEAGGEAEIGIVSLSIYGYARYTEDMINWGDPDGDGVWRPENLDAAAFFGADAEAGLELGDLDVTASYALTLSYNLANGQELTDDVRVANIPVHTIKLEPAYALGDVKLSLRGSWRSERYINSTKTLDPVFLLGARVQYAVMDGLSVYLDADNLLNADYVETDGYPMPGRTLKTGLRITLD